MDNREKQKILLNEVKARANSEAKEYAEKVKKMTDEQINKEFESLIGL